MAVDLAPRVTDLRIAGPAMVMWIAAALLVGVPASAARVLLTASVTVVGACAVGASTRHTRRRLDVLSRDRHVLGAVLGLTLTTASLCSLLAVAVLVGDARRSPAVLDGLDRGRVTVEVVLARDLAPGDRSVIGTLQRVDDHGGLRVPVRVVPARDDGDRAARRTAAGTRLVSSAELEPDEPGRTTASVVFLRGHAAEQPPTGFLGATDRARQAFVQVTQPLPEPGGSLLRGLAIGDRSGLDPTTEAAMETSALTHLTAVSGNTSRQGGGCAGCSSAGRKRALASTERARSRFPRSAPQPLLSAVRRSLRRRCSMPAQGRP